MRSELAWAENPTGPGQAASRTASPSEMEAIRGNWKVRVRQVARPLLEAGCPPGGRELAGSRSSRRPAAERLPRGIAPCFTRAERLQRPAGVPESELPPRAPRAELPDPAPVNSGAAPYGPAFDCREHPQRGPARKSRSRRAGARVICGLCFHPGTIDFQSPALAPLRQARCRPEPASHRGARESRAFRRT